MYNNCTIHNFKVYYTHVYNKFSHHTAVSVLRFFLDLGEKVSSIEVLQ